MSRSISSSPAPPAPLLPIATVYLGVQANVDGASGDKHISYPTAGQSITPQDDPLSAFELMFGDYQGGEEGEAPVVDPVEVSVIDGVLDDMQRLRTRLGDVEKSKLDYHLESLREVEKRIKKTGGGVGGATCEDPALDLTSGELYAPERFPELLKAQLDLAVLTGACGMSDVIVVQAGHHTSELLMSRFAGTAMYDPSFDMRSHQASHYGASHDPNKREYEAFHAQRLWWMEQLAYLLGELDARPEGDGTMLDHSLVVCCTEVCDGNTHLHDDMPFLISGGAGGAISTGRPPRHRRRPSRRSVDRHRPRHGRAHRLLRRHLHRPPLRPPRLDPSAPERSFGERNRALAMPTGLQRSPNERKSLMGFPFRTACPGVQRGPVGVPPTRSSACTGGVAESLAVSPWPSSKW